MKIKKEGREERMELTYRVYTARLFRLRKENSSKEWIRLVIGDPFGDAEHEDWLDRENLRGEYFLEQYEVRKFFSKAENALDIAKNIEKRFGGTLGTLDKIEFIAYVEYVRSERNLNFLKKILVDEFGRDFELKS